MIEGRPLSESEHVEKFIFRTWLKCLAALNRPETNYAFIDGSFKIEPKYIHQVWYTVTVFFKLYKNTKMRSTINIQQ